MAESHNIFEEDRYVDRISLLPGDVLESIMAFLPTRDAARTCVLSSKWRYVWVDHPSLVLNGDFWVDIQWNRPNSLKSGEYANIVSSILLYHVGHIRRFVLDVSVMSSLSHLNIDLWLSFLCRRKPKELSLRSSFKNKYQVPCWVFSTRTLIDLSFCCCIIKAEDTFAYIQSLKLTYVTFGSSVVLTTPLLTSLILYKCSGLRDFDISAPKLASLNLNDNDYLNLKPFLACTSIEDAYVASSKETGYCESLNLVKLLAAWSRILLLMVDGVGLKYLTAGSNSIPTTINQLSLKYLLILDLKLEDSGLMPWILWILKSSPLLHTFEIWFDKEGVVDDDDEENGNDEEEAASIMNMNMNMNRKMEDLRMVKLRTVTMNYFTCSKAKVMFAHNLLQSAPVLEKLLIQENDGILKPSQRLKILNKLVVLQRAFPKPLILFGPNLLPH